MWIRSQDKTHLVKCDHINIEERTKLKAYKENKNDLFLQFKEEGTGEWLVQNCEYPLGEYSSKGKAIKVLNMIENALKGEFSDRYTCCESPLAKPVFIMPQDDEV